MSNLGDDLVEAMAEVAAFVQGDVGMTKTHVVEVPNVDVATVRRQTGLRRPKFAGRFRIDP